MRHTISLRAASLTYIALATLFCGGVRCAETLDDVAKAVAAKYETLKSVKYDFQIEYDFMGTIYTATGSYELLNDGGTWKKRTEEKWRNTPLESKKDNAVEKQRVFIEDGEFTYTHDETSGDPRVEKTYLETYGETNIGARWFKRYRQESELTLLPDETLEGHSVYVIEAKSNKIGWTFLFYTDKGTGIMLKSVSTSTTKGQWTLTLLAKNIQLNTDIPRERFVFTPPPGLKVKDMTAELNDK